jgi:hypothetical protein
MEGVDQAVAAVGADRAEQLYELGRSLTMEEAIQFAIEEESEQVILSSPDPSGHD